MTSAMLELAIRAAREAGAILRDFAGRQFQIEHKGRINLVTEADLASERHIKELIAIRYPEHSILAEESGASQADSVNSAPSDYRWIIDPLDGTTNFAHGYPFYCVSIGLECKGEIMLGVIYDPTRDELFAAERGAGARLNNRAIRVSEVDRLERGLVVSGFPYDVRERMSHYLPAWQHFLERAQAVRRDGSAALNLSYVAMGRFDGYWEFGLSPWDMAAGSLIVEEAGGHITKTDGSSFDIYAPSLLCSNGKLHPEMLEVLSLDR
jgi:myo-inositol-1(or 4)-monophosphatase